jgi:hypothetical protein
MRILLALILLCVTSTAYGQADARYCRVGRDGIVVRDGALNGTVSFNVGPMQCGARVSSYTYMILELEYTHDSNGNVVVTCLTGQSVATADKAPQGCASVIDGVCTAADIGVVSKAVTADKKWAVRLGIRGYRTWTCTITHDGTPTASDLVTVRAHLAD